MFFRNKFNILKRYYRDIEKKNKLTDRNNPKKSTKPRARKRSAYNLDSSLILSGGFAKTCNERRKRKKNHLIIELGIEKLLIDDKNKTFFIIICWYIKTTWKPCSNSKFTTA